MAYRTDGPEIPSCCGPVFEAAIPVKDALPGGEPIRLSRRMSELGLASRREADEWIERGWVKVNGQPAQMGMQVGPNDRITVERAAQHQQRQHSYRHRHGFGHRLNMQGHQHGQCRHDGQQVTAGALAG